MGPAPEHNQKVFVVLDFQVAAIPQKLEFGVQLSQFKGNEVD